eukprot:1541006-Rhodomonas_salina.1
MVDLHELNALAVAQLSKFEIFRANDLKSEVYLCELESYKRRVPLTIIDYAAVLQKHTHIFDTDWNVS